MDTIELLKILPNDLLSFEQSALQDDMPKNKLVSECVIILLEQIFC